MRSECDLRSAVVELNIDIGSSDRARAGRSTAAQVTPLRRSTRHSLTNGAQTPAPAADTEEM